MVTEWLILRISFFLPGRWGNGNGEIGEFVYDLELRSDFSSLNPLMTQWFYFRIHSAFREELSGNH